MTDNSQPACWSCHGCTNPVFNCGVKECERYLHLRCYEAVLNNNKLDPLIEYNNQPVVVCTKNCYARYRCRWKVLQCFVIEKNGRKWMMASICTVIRTGHLSSSRSRFASMRLNVHCFSLLRKDEVFTDKDLGDKTGCNVIRSATSMRLTLTMSPHHFWYESCPIYLFSSSSYWGKRKSVFFYGLWYRPF